MAVGSVTVRHTIGRTLAAALVAAFLLATTGPVSAHDGTPHGSVTVSPGGDAISDTSTAVITGHLDAVLEEITSVTLKVRPTGGQANPEQSVNGCTIATSGGCNTSTMSVKWPVELAYNGPYVVEVAMGHRLLGLGESSTGPGTVPVAFRMAVPPRPPQNVKAEVRPERSIRISWDRNREPDVLGYVVERKGPDGEFKPLDSGFVRHPASGASVSTNDFSTAAGTGGSFTYRVRAARAGADPSDEKKALTSDYSTVAIADVPAGPGLVTPVPPSPPTPGPAPAGAGGGVNRRGSGTVDLSGFLGDVTPSPRPPELAAEPDTGFSETLPFSPGGEAQGRDASQDGESSNRRALLIPLAAGSALCVLALQLRWLTRRLNQAGPEEWSGEPWAGDDNDEYFAVSDPEWDDDPELVGAGYSSRPYEYQDSRPYEYRD